MKFLALLLPAALCAQTNAPPFVQEGKTMKVSAHVWVIPDGRVNLVPNIGIIAGSKATLVVDSGMGPKNGAVTLREVRKISPNAPLYLTTTHYHPEHVTGFQAFPASAQLVRPLVQQQEMLEGIAALSARFAKISPVHADLLKDVKLRPPDITFGDFVEIDLGGLTARIFTIAPAHTHGDNFILVKEDGVLFTGDVVVNRFYPIISDHGGSWIQVLDKLAELKPAKVVPGHGAVDDVGLIARERAFLVRMQDRARALKSQGKSADQAVAVVSKELRAAYPDWDNPEFLSAGIRRFYAEAP